jgi:hypothetical protein
MTAPAAPITVAPILLRALRDGAVFAGLVAVVSGGVGLLVDGSHGLIGGLLGASLAFVYLGLTAVSMLVAARLTRGDATNPVYYAVILGSFLLKLIVFFVVGMWLRTQDWLNPVVFFISAIIAVLGSLVLDSIALQRSRVPYVSDVSLPGDEAPARPPAKP